MTTPSLPQAADPARLTEALRRAGALCGARVADVAIERSFDTILSHIFRLRLTYDGPAPDAPGSLILKAGLVDRPGGPWKGGRQEVAFYKTVAPATAPGLVPRCFDAACDPDSGAWHLLLEDLTESHHVATRWPLPPTIAQCETIIWTRARFQAAWWDEARLGTTVGSWQDEDATDQSLQRLGDQLALRLGRRPAFGRSADALSAPARRRAAPDRALSQPSPHAHP